MKGSLTEESFKGVVRQFEPQLKEDRLSRLWHFADVDGSGKLDIVEFMRIFGVDSNGTMSDEYYEARGRA